MSGFAHPPLGLVLKYLSAGRVYRKEFIFVTLPTRKAIPEVAAIFLSTYVS